jgi:hypothetical protein
VFHQSKYNYFVTRISLLIDGMYLLDDCESIIDCENDLLHAIAGEADLTDLGLLLQNAIHQ